MPEHSLLQRVICSLLVVIWLVAVTTRANATSGLLIAGYHPEREQWQLYIQSDNQSWQDITTEVEVRTPVYHSQTNKLIYINDAGSIVESTPDFITGKVQNQRDVVQANDVTFTQPSFSRDGARLFAVALENGVSQHTDIVMFEFASQALSTVVSQRSAQFEPKEADNALFYSSVSCIPPACNRIIEEIWQINPVTQEAQQLTLLNATSREPAPIYSGDIFYFVSDAQGAFHIWRYHDGIASAITYGDVSDSTPAVTPTGSVIFVRRENGQADRIMEWLVDSERLVEHAVPEGVTRLRDLSTWNDAS